MTKFNLSALLDKPDLKFPLPASFAEQSRLMAGGFKRGEMWIMGGGQQMGRSTIVQHTLRLAILDLLHNGKVLEFDFRKLGQNTAVTKIADNDGPAERAKMLASESMALTDADVYTWALAASAASSHGTSVPTLVGWHLVHLRNNHAAHVADWAWQGLTAAERKQCVRGWKASPGPRVVHMAWGVEADVGEHWKYMFVDSIPEKLVQAQRDHNKVLATAEYSIGKPTPPTKLTNGQPVREHNYLQLRKGFKK